MKVIKKTVKTDLGEGKVKVSHTQMIRQSMDFQSAECSYGVEMTCDSSRVKEVMNNAEEFVQVRLLKKSKEQQDLLIKIAQTNRK